jgi:hypothetical protein
MDQVTVESVGDLSVLIPSFQRSLRAANKSAKTLATYSEACNQLLAFLRDSGMPTEVSKISREHVESFIERLVATKAPATASNRYRALCALFNFLVDFGEITVSPMAKMKPPAVPETVWSLGAEEAVDGGICSLLGGRAPPRRCFYSHCRRLVCVSGTPSGVAAELSDPRCLSLIKLRSVGAAHDEARWWFRSQWSSWRLEIWSATLLQSHVTIPERGRVGSF